MYIPQELLKSIAKVVDIDIHSFTNIHDEDRYSSLRYNPLKMTMAGLKKHFPSSNPIAWAEDAGIQLTHPYKFQEDPLWHAGAYYVQEASSMFLDFILSSLDLKKNEPSLWLDLCASPGGKTTIMHDHLGKRDVLIANEPISNRKNALIENVIKWGMGRTVVTKHYPHEFGALAQKIDVILADVPCSGSGLFRKKTDYSTEWSRDLVAQCVYRQKKIVQDILPSLKDDGYFIYCTCSYSSEENEDMVDFILDQSNLVSVEMVIDHQWGIVATSSPKHQAVGYRFFPHLCGGEGFYIAVFRKPATTSVEKDKVKPRFSGNVHKSSSSFPLKIAKGYATYVQDILGVNDILSGKNMYQHEDNIYAMDEDYYQQYSYLSMHLYPRYITGFIGKSKGTMFIPKHSLAMNPAMVSTMSMVELDRPNALLYIRREQIAFLPSKVEETKWSIVSHQHIPLGFIRILTNQKVNNYYPTSWNIHEKILG